MSMLCNRRAFKGGRRSSIMAAVGSLSSQHSPAHKGVDRTSSR
jgi:hypothetical protein